MRVRDARASDYDAYVALFREIDSGDNVPSRAEFEADRLGKTTVVEIDGEVVAYAVLALTDPTLAHVSELAVSPSARRRGLGRALLAWAAEVAERAGRTVLSLNVRADNAPAVRLYEAFGFEPVSRQEGLLVDWAVVEGWPEAPARPLEPADDARAEAAFAIASGTFAAARAIPGRVLRVIERGGEIAACASFDPAFPGALPFRARTPEDAMAMLRALRPHARPGDTLLKINVVPEIAAALVARGARPRYGLVHMRARINRAVPGTS